MLGKNHAPIAAASWLLAAPFLGVTSPWIIAATVPVAFVAGLLPDVDHQGSYLGSRLPGVSHLIRAIFGHRGATHSLLAAGLCLWGLVSLRNTVLLATSPFTVLASAMILAIVVGYLSHLVADGLTKTGVPLLWPMKKSFRSPLSFTTGSAIEYIVTYAFLAFTIYHLALPLLALVV